MLFDQQEGLAVVSLAIGGSGWGLWLQLAEMGLGQLNVAKLRNVDPKQGLYWIIVKTE